MNEAVRTSVLSKRWRHIWAYVPRLIFDGSEIVDKTRHDDEALDVETIRYIRWVDHVVRSHKAPTINEIRLRFLLSVDWKHKIDKWVKFAAENGVKKLELDFGSSIGGYLHHIYSFPSLSFLHSLTSLQLTYVNVNGEVLERLICNCKALEFLSVAHSGKLFDLKVGGPSLNLKSLRLGCLELKILEISAPNLVSMDYTGPGVCGTPFKNTPKLVKLSVCGNSIIPHPLMSPITHQIEEFQLSACSVKHFSKAFPSCIKLKTLNISQRPRCDKDMFRVISVIKACPFLHKLVLQINQTTLPVPGKKLKLNLEEPWCHDHLKVAEIVGYVGSAFGFVRYLLRNVVSLEKLIIDPLPPFDLRFVGMPIVDKKITKARKQAEQLHAYLKPGTELEIR